MADHHATHRSEHSPHLHGDEADLFREFNDILLAAVAKRVNTSRAIVEDACAFAWLQFLLHPPDRQRAWRAWMIKVAERRAWLLHREDLIETTYEVRNEGGVSVLPDPVDHRDRTEQYLDVTAALETLAQLPERRRQAKELHVQGYTYEEIAPVLGVSSTRVDHLVREANQAIREISDRAEVESRPRSSRAARLEVLERHPPHWLTPIIGRPWKTKVERLMAWKAAALAIDDYRRDHLKPGDGLLGERPADPCAARSYDLAVRAAERVHAIDSRGLER